MSLQSPDGAIAVTRFGLGAKPGEIARADADPRGWLKAQVARAGADQPAGPLPGSRDRFNAYTAALAQVRIEKLDIVAATTDAGQPRGSAGAPDRADQLKAQRRALLAPLRDGVRDEVLARTQLATTTDAPFRERWALFWCNHFTVSTAKAKAAMLAGPFEREAIRPHVFGRFETLLVASSTHPAMMVYLDQPRSTGPRSAVGDRKGDGLNENLGREIMELHSLGADAGYTQADVTEFAKALTGYSIALEKDGAQFAGLPAFRPDLHEPGERTVLGRRYAQVGAGQARAILADLASNPHTADHISRKIAAHFVADDPPLQLVARLREAWIESHGDLAVVAVALVEAPESWSPQSAKFKRPYEFLVSSYRALGAVPIDGDKEVIGPLTQLGERPMAAPQPNGWSEQVADWAAPDAVVKRLNWSAKLATAKAATVASPVEVADAALGPRLTPAVRAAIARAETRPEALTLLYMSPEFQRR